MNEILIGFRLSDHSIEQEYLDLAETLIERAAFYDDRLCSQDGKAGHGSISAHLSTDYTNLRILIVSIYNM